MAEKKKHAGGRPSKYAPAYCVQAKKLCRLGHTDVEIADFLEVDVRTLHRWKIEHEEFCHALKEGKVEADARVEASLYHKAVGYTFDTVKIMSVSMGGNLGSEVREIPYREHIAPDTTAAIFWLKNRQPERWRDKQEHEHTGKDGASLIPVLNVTIGRTEPEPSS